MNAIILLSVLAVTLIAALLLNQIRRPKNFPPGPTWWPILENFIQFKKLSIKYGGIHIAFQKLSEQFKTNILGLKLGGDYVIAVSGYPLVHDILTSDVFNGKPNSFFLRTRCLGSLRGIFCLDGKVWAEQRNFVDRQLRNAGYGKRSMEYLINEELEDIIQLLKTEKPDVEFEPVFSPPILNIVWSLLTGCRIRKDDSRIQNLLSLLEKRAKAFDQAGGTLNQFPWLRYIFPEMIGYNLVLRINKEMKELFLALIRQHHDTWVTGRQDNLIYAFITELKRSEENTKTFTDEQLIIIFWDLFLGATQTSGSTITFILLMMLLHPDVQEKAWKEIKETLNADEPIYYADRVKIPYVEAIILEVSRLYPVSALAAPRRVLRNTVLNGYTIPQGTTVYANIYSVHHDVEYWGDPHVFRPERFLDEKGNIQNNERLMQFGLGKRRCLGELLARQCIFIFFVGILRKYQLCPVPDTESPSPKPARGIFLTPEKFKIRLISRLNT